VKDLTEETFPLPIEQAYEKLKGILLREKCEIIEEKSAEYILIRQGSLDGFLPRSAKKMVKFHLYGQGAETKITTSTEIASDWTNLTVLGNIAAAVLAGVLFSIASDIENYVEQGKTGFWTWLATAYGYPDRQRTIFMVNFTRALAIFLTLMIVVEILIAIYVYRGKDKFAQETLHTLRH